MSLYAIGDLHLTFGGQVDKPMDIYGGPWVRHTEKLQERWRELIRPEDTVLIPGDISWAMHLRDAIPDLLWIAELPGTKVLLRGNHDLWWGSLKKMADIHDSLFFLQNNCYEGDDFIIAGSRGWLCPGDKDFTEDTDRKIYERELIRLDLSLKDALAARKRAEENGIHKQLIGAMHFPPMNERKQASGFTEAFARAGVVRVVYGHLHGETAYSSGPQGMYDGVEYLLCSLDKLIGEPKQIVE